MKKIVNPSMCEVYGGTCSRGFAKIEYENGRLSICGVIGPMSNGNCKGSAGQCVDAIREGSPAEGWSAEMLQEFCDIWDRWHLNDLNPCCEHQRELGWLDLASKRVPLYHYRLTSAALKKKKDAEDAAIAALNRGETFTPSDEQVKFASLPYSTVTHEPLVLDEGAVYEPKKSLFPGDCGPIEHKALGWLKLEEHPDGILCKPCPVCGYKYGTAWQKEEVPQEVIDWLFALPDASVRPAWV